MPRSDRGRSPRSDTRSRQQGSCRRRIPRAPHAQGLGRDVRFRGASRLHPSLRDGLRPCSQGRGRGDQRTRRRRSLCSGPYACPRRPARRRSRRQWEYASGAAAGCGRGEDRGSGPGGSRGSRGGARISCKKKNNWRIRFSLPANSMANGTNPLGLLDELRDLGECTVRADTSAIPPLDEFTPTELYIFWDVTLISEQDRSAIDDVFIFVLDDMEISVEEIDGAAGAIPAPAEAKPLSATAATASPAPVPRPPCLNSVPSKRSPPSVRRQPPARRRRPRMSAFRPSVSTS